MKPSPKPLPTLRYVPDRCPLCGSAPMRETPQYAAYRCGLVVTITGAGEFTGLGCEWPKENRDE